MGTCASSSCRSCVQKDDDASSLGIPLLEAVPVVSDDDLSLKPCAIEYPANTSRSDPVREASELSEFSPPTLGKLGGDSLPSDGDRTPKTDRANVILHSDADRTPKTDHDSCRASCEESAVISMPEEDTEYISPRSSMSGAFKFDDVGSQPDMSDDDTTSVMLDNGWDNRSESTLSLSMTISPLFSEEAKKKAKRICRRSSKEVMDQTKGTISDALQVIIEKNGAIESFYNLQESLGVGSFGAVHKAKVKASGASRAVKKISKDAMKGSLKHILREISVMKKLDHPHVIKLYEIFETGKDILLVMEICACGTLTDLVKKRGPSTEQQTADIMRQIISAVYYLHKNFICHRDLKPDNILLFAHHPLTLKVVDFGVSCVFATGRLLTKKAGTLAFMAPEVMRKKYNHNCDMWSCGVIMYFVLCGYLPFAGDTDKELVKMVQRGVYAFETIEWVDVTAPTMDFIGLLLKKSFRARYTAEQAIHHDWFTVYVEQTHVHLRSDLLSNLYTFRRLNKLKRSALIILASMLRAEDVKEGHRVFLQLDHNGDGTLSLSELRKALSKQRNGLSPDGKLEGVFQEKANHSGDEKLKPFTYTEFLAATFDRKRCITEKLLKATFAAFDKNGDGSLSLSELSEGHLLGHLSLEDLAQTLEDLDLNGDCFLDFDEFSQMMQV